MDCFRLRFSSYGGHVVASLPRNDDDKATPRYLLVNVALHLRAQAVAQIGAGHAVGDVGAKEAGFGAAIVALAFELDAVEFLRLRQPDHGVGELDLAAGAALLRLQDIEDLRLQDV